MSERPRWRKKRWAVPALTFLMLFIMAGFAWTNRIDIADGYLADQLEASGLPATYDVERIGGQTQIIGDLVIGDPDAPDFTAERVIVRLRHRFGLPRVGGVTLVEPRLYGRYIDGEMTFGSLDGVIFGDSSETSGLPDIDLAIRDGRALIESDFGPVGVKAQGSGNLRSGFQGLVAATAPQLSFSDCKLARTSFFGTLTTKSGEPSVDGPLRVSKLSCAGPEVSVTDIVAQIEASTTADLVDPEIVAQISTDRAGLGAQSAQSLSGTIRAQVRGDALSARYSLAARDAETPVALAAILTAEGTVRGRDNLTRFEIESDVEGNGLRMGASLIASIEELAQAGDGTLLQPIAQRVGTALKDQTRGSALAASMRYRSDEDGYAFVMPEAELTGGGGARLLSVSRMEYSSRNGNAPRLAGNIATAGPGIPRISGRMERSRSGEAVFRLSMEPYQAGGAQIEVPQMVIAQGASGAMGFSGTIEATGPIPGGAVDGLSVPIVGRLASDGRLSLWRDCTMIAFRRLAIAQLNIAGPGLTLCPSDGASIVTVGEGGTTFSARSQSIELAGSLGDTPLSLYSGALSISSPGEVVLDDLDISLGSGEDASRFEFGRVEAAIGENIAGQLENGTVSLAAVPMDIHNLSGTFTYADSLLTLDESSFRLLDREETDRFEPLIARNAQLTFVDNIIKAAAILRNPASDRIVAEAEITHNLSSSAGFADLEVPGLVFDERLQPVDISLLTKGVIANADGTVQGEGRIDWAADGSISSSGTFGTQDFDFAAAFGPVEGVSGMIQFTDLLELTTAPGQKLQVASVNPGIEVTNGVVEFELKNSQLLSIDGGIWPFMGGQLILRQFDFNFGVSEERSYVFEIVGLDAGQFVTEMELENIAATGTFDGTIPIIFDTDGNGRIEDGMLISRAPGGSLSYVGELTYEDLSAMANFAFDALRSLEYTQMMLVMEGPLTGEIITRVRIDGVRQGADAERNFITRQVAKLPLQFRINIRAQFYELMSSMKAMYDPSSVRDPRELGLVDSEGRTLRQSITSDEIAPEIDPEDVIPDEPTIQDQESE